MVQLFKTVLLNKMETSDVTILDSFKHQTNSQGCQDNYPRLFNQETGGQKGTKFCTYFDKRSKGHKTSMNVEANVKPLVAECYEIQNHNHLTFPKV